MGNVDGVTHCELCGRLDDTPEFTNIPRPGIGFKELCGGGSEWAISNEVARQQADVALALTQ